MKFQDSWQTNIRFTIDELLIGTGWYEIEKQGKVRFRWLGPDPKATIHMNPYRDRVNRLNITLHSIASSNILENFSIEADNIPLQITTSSTRNPTYITAVLPEDRSKSFGDPTIFTFKIPETIKEEGHGSTYKESRYLGVALREINIFPLRRPIFVANKYDDPTPFDGLNYLKGNPGVKDAVIGGAYRSAYEYYIQNGRSNEMDSFVLNETFDERPGDLYDIIYQDMKEEIACIQEDHRSEISLLKEMINIQNETVQAFMRNGGSSSA